jgi:hypothetical protein
MIRLGLRLALADAAGKAMVSIMTLAVAVGTALLIVALGVAPAIQARADRTAWMHASYAPVIIDSDDPIPHTRMGTSTDHHHGDAIDVVTLAGIGSDTPIPPTLDALPSDGEVLVSPALGRLLRSAPILGQRYGRVVGTVGEGALAGPDHLLAIRGVSADEAAISGLPVVEFAKQAPRVLRSGAVEQVSGTVRLIILLGAVAILTPVVLFIVMATRLSAASRDRRLATLRLAGAATSQVHGLAAVETLIAAAGGVIAGVGLFFAARRLATYLSPDGRWFPSDLTPGLASAAAVVICVPLAALIVAQAALSDVARSPLHVSRRANPQPVRAWRLLPLGASIALLGYVLSTDAAQPAGGGEVLVMVAFLLLLLALVYTGPWFARASGLLLARARGAARLLAGRRLAADPRGGFRAIAGVVLAILVTTVFVAATPSAAESLRDRTVLGQQTGSAQAAISSMPVADAEALVGELRALDGVSGAALVYQGVANSEDAPLNVWIGDCAAIARAAKLASVPCGQAPVVIAENRQGVVSGSAKVIDIYNLTPAESPGPTAASPGPTTESPGPSPDQEEGRLTASLRSVQATTMPAQTGIDMPGVLVSPEVIGPLLPRLRPGLILVRYEHQDALERVRSLVLQESPNNRVTTRESTDAALNSNLRNFYRILAVATLGAFLVAGAALVVATAVGLLERRRPFALLRVAGTPLRTLRLTLCLEAAAPLVVMSAVSSLLGLLVGRWTVQSGGQQGGVPMTAGLPIVAGLAMSMVVLVCVAPIVRRLTNTEETRLE